MPVQFDVFYSLLGRVGRRFGQVIDLSSGGLRLATDEDIPAGSTLQIDMQLPDDFLSELTIEKEVFQQTPFGARPEMIKTQPAPFAPMRVGGTALATFFLPTTGQLAHGLQFLDLEAETKEELQRFVHLWQLHQLRARQKLQE